MAQLHTKESWILGLCLLCTNVISVISDISGINRYGASIKPNIVIIMADDLGFDDISFRGSNELITPNIDAFAYSGVILKNLYTASMCTPSRSALLTGKYPIHTGMQHYVIPNDQPWGLPINETTMAEIFQAGGYFTSIIGKWHLGMSRKAYTPTYRGFNHHFGYLGAYIDYYDHTLYSSGKNYSRGHDFRENLVTSHKHAGSYATDVLTKAAIELIQTHNVTKKPLFMILSHLAPHAGNDDAPLQAPKEEIDKLAHIRDEQRQTYAAMVSILDRSVGQVIDALSKRSMLNNTIILFLSDNGGPTRGLHSTTASNYPLKGQKDSPWEGGIRSSGAIWSRQFEKLGSVWKQNIYIADLLPTLAEAANIKLDLNFELDGLNLWSALKYGYESVVREIVHNIDEIEPYISYAKGPWKFINGSTVQGAGDDWIGSRPLNESEWDPRYRNYEQVIRETSVWQQLSVFNDNNPQINVTELRAAAAVTCKFTNTTQNTPCNPLSSPCLFNIDMDPCEQQNLYEQYKNVKLVDEMMNRIDYFRKRAHLPNNKLTDPHCDPANYNNEWTWWEDEVDRNSAVASCMGKYTNLVLIVCIIKLTVSSVVKYFG